MDMTPYTDGLRREFLLAAGATGEEALGLAERLVPSLDSAVRLTLLNALSAAADEISRDLAPGAVDLRLRGLEPDFVVTVPWDGTGAGERPAGTGAGPVGAAFPAAADEGATARINFRPTEHLKARIEDAAAREGLSVNAWLVRAVTAVLNGATRPEGPVPPAGRHSVGWVR
ncbi:hypothetical protein [Streptomyces abikoensis]